MIGGENASLRESLSALMDGETTEFEVRSTLRAIAGQERSAQAAYGAFGLRDTWHRYQLASLAMHGEFPLELVDLSARVRAAIDAEPALGVSRLRRWVSPLGRIAVAASVAAIAVLAIQQFQPDAPLATATAVVGVNVSGDVATAPEQMAAPVQPLPGFHFPRVGARTVSMDSFERPQQRAEMVGGLTLVNQVSQQQIQAYLNALIVNHAERDSSGVIAEVTPLVQLPPHMKGQRP